MRGRQACSRCSDSEALGVLEVWTLGRDICFARPLLQGWGGS